MIIQVNVNEIVLFIKSVVIIISSVNENFMNSYKLAWDYVLKIVFM